MLATVWGAGYFRNIFQVVTDHEALVSLLKGNSKKNKTMFSGLTRWLDRLTRFDFEVEHMPLVKFGSADYLSRHPNSEAKPVSTYDSMFTVAKIRSIQSALGNKTNFTNCSTSVNNEASNGKLANGNRICKFGKEKPTVEGEKPCYNKTANKNAEICIRHRSREKLYRRSPGSKNRLFGAITTYTKRQAKSICRTEQGKINSKDKSMDKSMRQIQKFLQRHPSFTSSEDGDEELTGEGTLNASTTKTIGTNSNTVLSIPPNFPGETFPTLTQLIMLCR